MASKGITVAFLDAFAEAFNRKQRT